jgi:hypothetical protein
LPKTDEQSAAGDARKRTRVRRWRLRGVGAGRQVFLSKTLKRGAMAKKGVEKATRVALRVFIIRPRALYIWQWPAAWAVWTKSRGAHPKNRPAGRGDSCNARQLVGEGEDTPALVAGKQATQSGDSFKRWRAANRRGEAIERGRGPKIDWGSGARKVGGAVFCRDRGQKRNIFQIFD